MSDLPPCPWCGKAPKRGVRDGFPRLTCRGWLQPMWREITHTIDVWAYTDQGAENRWRKTVERLTALRPAAIKRRTS